MQPAVAKKHNKALIQPENGRSQYIYSVAMLSLYHKSIEMFFFSRDCHMILVFKTFCRPFILGGCERDPPAHGVW